MWNVRFWLRVSKKSPGSEFLKQWFNVGGNVESILPHVQLTGTKVAKNPAAPTSSTASATNGNHRAMRDRKAVGSGGARFDVPHLIVGIAPSFSRSFRQAS